MSEVGDEQLSSDEQIHGCEEHFNELEERGDEMQIGGQQRWRPQRLLGKQGIDKQCCCIGNDPEQNIWGLQGVVILLADLEQQEQEGIAKFE